MTKRQYRVVFGMLAMILGIVSLPRQGWTWGGDVPSLVEIGISSLVVLIGIVSVIAGGWFTRDEP